MSRIIDSHFTESLVFEDVEHQSVDRRSLSDLAKLGVDPPFMWVQSSHFMQNLTFIRSNFGELDIVGNRINNFNSSRSSFGQELSVVENDIEALQINCSILARKATISFNNIHKDLLVEGDAIGRRQSGRCLSRLSRFVA